MALNPGVRLGPHEVVSAPGAGGMGEVQAVALRYDAVQELARANQQDPRILSLTALAYRESGDARQAALFARKAATFNGLPFNYAYVRNKAAKLIAFPTE